MREDKPCYRPHDKTLSITVNGRRRQVECEVLSFGELVDIAFAGPASGPQIVFTITFREADDPMAKGELDEGQSLKVRNGTIINVTMTDQGPISL